MDGGGILGPHTRRTALNARPRITVVNDNPEFLELIGEILTDERYATSLIDGEEHDAVEGIRRSEPDVLMIDLRMGDERLTGWTVAQEVRRDPTLRELPILLCTADLAGLEAVRDELESTERTAVLVKPFGIDTLIRSIDSLLAEASPS